VSMKTGAQIAAELNKPGELRQFTVAELAGMVFGQRERVNMLEASHTPFDFDDRKRAFIELAEAKASLNRLNRQLEAAIASGRD
jgi:hypothetical protein